MTTDAAREGFEAWAENRGGMFCFVRDREGKTVRVATPECMTALDAWQAALASAGQQQARVAELEAECERLREALKPFADLANSETISDALSFSRGDHHPTMLLLGRGFTAEALSPALFAAARAALARQAGG